MTTENLLQLIKTNPEHPFNFLDITENLFDISDNKLEVIKETVEAVKKINKVVEMSDVLEPCLA